jgi:hypothetical protein
MTGRLGASEPTEFTLTLRWEGPNRIRTFALIRELRGLGLKETKAIIENLPAVLVEDGDIVRWGDAGVPSDPGMNGGEAIDFDVYNGVRKAGV